jgi:PAS domain S-box-containing protein
LKLSVDPTIPGTGSLAVMVRTFDWSETPLGPIVQWPASLRTVVNFLLQSPTPIVLLWGPSGVMIYNDSYSEFAGNRHPGMLGQSVEDGWPEVAGFNANVMEVCLAGGTLRYKDQELTLYRQGRAEQVWMNLDYSPVHGEDGEVAGVIAIVLETTERVLADRRIAAEHARQRQLFSQMPGFVAVTVGPQHVYEYVNDAYVRISGRNDFVGLSVREVFPELAGQGFYELLDQVYVTGRAVVAQAMKLRLRDTDAVKFIDFVYEPIRDEKGDVTGIFVGGYEVTEAQRAVTATERLIETFFDHSSECHAVLVDARDGSFRYEAANPATLRLYGKTREEVIGHTTSELFGVDGATELNRHLATCLREGVPYRYERIQGTGIVEAVATPVLDEMIEAGRIVVSARDVTESRRLEEQLRQAQKMEAVGQLTGGIAHDFNNLLTGISGSLEILGRRIAEERFSNIERYLNLAQASTRRAAALTQRLLAFSRRQTLDPKPTDVNRLVSGMEDLIRRTVGPSIEVEVVGAGGLWLTQIDQSQLENTLLNLVINARDAMPDGGRITVETANKWLDHRVANTRELPPGQYIALSVTDTGSGMTPEVIKQAFDPFFTTKPLGQGTGLGLSMIHGFVRQSGGQVRLYSEVGRGTTVGLYFPRFAGNLDEVEVAGAETAIGTGHGETVLVIDDEQTVRALIADVLDEAGYRVLDAADGSAGLKILQSAVRIDLLITDVGLPGGFNGRQVADAARNTRPDLKVLFITGYAENAVVGNGHLDRGMQVITKPFEMKALAARVRDIIDG